MQEDAAVGRYIRSARRQVREIKLIGSECYTFDPKQVVTQASTPDGIDLIDRSQVEIADECDLTAAFRAAGPHDKCREIDDRVAVLFCRVPKDARLACALPAPLSATMAGPVSYLHAEQIV